MEESVPHATHHGHTHLLELPPLSASFPLPFRVLTLLGFAILLWATNLHILHLLGINVPKVLDFRDKDPVEEGGDVFSDNPRGMEEDTVGRGESSKAHIPVYKLAGVYTAFVSCGWLVFRVATGGEVESMEEWRGLVGLVMLGAFIGALAPWRGIGERERRGLRRYVALLLASEVRCARADVQGVEADTRPVIILASLLLRCHLGGYPHFVRQGLGRSLGLVMSDLAGRYHRGQSRSKRLVEVYHLGHGLVSLIFATSSLLELKISLPYALRFRQCIFEYHQSSYSSPRPLANALKYFSAFPVILLSALQKTVVADLAFQKGITIQELRETHDRWFGEHPLFRLWLLAVVINSMFSFYWDVEMDWGLRLCEVDTWLPPLRQATSTSTPTLSRRDSTEGGIWQRAVGCLRRNDRSLGHQRSPCPTPGPTFNGRSSPHARNQSRGLSVSLSSPILSTSKSSIFTFGLRQILLLPDPIVYHIFTILDLILRFTWSLKLSAHLHTIAEIESGVFMMEALELLRRWMWVFVRVEWEAVKQAEVKSFTETRGLGIVSGQVVWEGDKEGV
jgi:hypothetical protein